ncbi:SPRY domain-containing protein [Bradyrhizobium sp.]|uniref:SPRY domain-containing protein n=1 Tax=Bradyrhizobium sp. TaxID=376 RepID=UPI0039E3A43C
MIGISLDVPTVAILGKAIGSAPQLPFITNGASQPWASVSFGYSSLHVPSTNTDWHFWETYDVVNGSQYRRPYCATFNQTTKQWLGNYVVGTENTLDATDPHGMPLTFQDSAGYVYALYGPHSNVSIKIAATLNPNDPTAWVQLPPLGNNATFVNALWGNSKAYVFANDYGAGLGYQESIKLYTGTPSNGYITWDAGSILFDSATAGIDGWLPNSFFVQNGTDIHMLFNYGPTVGADISALYHAILDETTGTIRNLSNSASILSGGRPGSLSVLNSNFRVVNSTNISGGTFAIDSSGNLHIVYADGATSPPTLKYIKSSSGVFAAPVTIYTYPASLYAGSVEAAVVINDSGDLDVYFPDASVGVGQPNNSTDDIGNLMKMTRKASDGSWSSAAVVLSKSLVSSGHGLGFPLAVLGGTSQARLKTAELAPNYTTPISTNKGFILNDAGKVLSRPAGFATILPPSTSFDPAHTSANLTLSDGNTVEVAVAPGGWTRALASKSSGLWYFSATILADTANQSGVGLMNASELAGNYIGQTNNSIGYYPGGDVYLNGAAVASIGSYAVGDVIGVAMNRTTNKVWFRKNGNGWNGGTLASQNPATGTGGISISNISGALFPAVVSGANNGSISAFKTPYLFGPPQGFANFS